jgi:hypothetical protein
MSIQVLYLLLLYKLQYVARRLRLGREQAWWRLLLLQQAKVQITGKLARFSQTDFINHKSSNVLASIHKTKALQWTASTCCLKLVPVQNIVLVVCAREPTTLHSRTEHKSRQAKAP